MGVINEEAPQLTVMSTNEGAARIGVIVAKDNEKFEVLRDHITDQAEKFKLIRQRSVEVRRADANRKTHFFTGRRDTC